MTAEEREEWIEEMKQDAYNNRANEIADAKHDNKMEDDLDYAIEYLTKKYNLDDAYQTILKANDELTEYGWQLSTLELFKEI